MRRLAHVVSSLQCVGRAFKPRHWIVVIVAVFVIVGAPAGIAWGGIDILKPLSELLYAIMKFFGMVLELAASILVGVAQYNDFANASVVTTGWTIVRDVSNMFFIFVLLVIAFGTLFQIQKYRFNALLRNVIIMAFLINFSKTITFFFIDLMQVIALTFVNAFATQILGNFLHMLGIADIYTAAKGTGANGASVSLDVFATMVLGVILMAVAAVVVVLYAIFFLVRIIALWVLTVLSPLAYLLSTFPSTAKYSQQWWSEFWKYASVGPVLAFFLWLSFAIAASGLQKDTTALTGCTSDYVSGVDCSAGFDAAAGGGGGNNLTNFITQAGQVPNLTQFLVAIILLVVSLKIASQSGIVGGQLASKLSSSIQKGRLPVISPALGMTYRKYLQRPLEQNVAKNAMGVLAMTRLPILSTLGRTGVANLEARKKKQQDAAEKQMKNIDRHTWAGRQVREGQMGQSPLSRAFRWTDYGAQARERAAVKMHPETANPRSLASYIQDPRTESKEFANWSVSRIRGVRNQQVQWNGSHPDDQIDFPHHLSRLSEEIVQQRESVATLDEPEPLSDEDQNDPRKVAEYNKKRAMHIDRNTSVRSETAGLEGYRYHYLDRNLVPRDTEVTAAEESARAQELREHKRRQNISMLAEEVNREGGGAAAVPPAATPAGGGGAGGGGPQRGGALVSDVVDERRAEARRGKAMDAISSWDGVVQAKQGSSVKFGADFNNPMVRDALAVGARTQGKNYTTADEKSFLAEKLAPVFEQQRRAANSTDVDQEVAKFRESILNASDVRITNSTGSASELHTGRHELWESHLRQTLPEAADVQKVFGSLNTDRSQALLQQVKTLRPELNETDQMREVMAEIMASSRPKTGKPDEVGRLRDQQKGPLQLEANDGEMALQIRARLSELGLASRPKTSVRQVQPAVTSATPPARTATSVADVAEAQKPQVIQAPQGVRAAAPVQQQPGTTEAPSPVIQKETIRETRVESAPRPAGEVPKLDQVDVRSPVTQQLLAALVRNTADTVKALKNMKTQNGDHLADAGSELQLNMGRLPTMSAAERADITKRFEQFRADAAKLIQPKGKTP